MKYILYRRGCTRKALCVVVKMLQSQWRLLCLLIVLVMFGNILLILYLPRVGLSVFETNSAISNLKLMRWINLGTPRPRPEFNGTWIGIDVIRYNHTSSSDKLVRVQWVTQFDLELFLETTNAPNTKLPKNEVIIFSAIARTAVTSDVWDFIVVNAWETSRLRNTTSGCCLLFNDGRILKTRPVDKAIFLDDSLAAVQVTCSNVISEDKTDVLIGVTLTYHAFCPTDTASYVRPEYPRRCADDFCMAVCSKVVYGNIDPGLVVEWMEYQMYMRVNKVVMFTYNLTSAATKVLRFYEQKGFAELHRFDFPRKDSPHHTVGDKVLSSWTDEQLAVFDCHNRLRGYEYVGIFDLDEFLVPAEEENFQDLMTSLKHRYPFSASFTFNTQLHATDWVADVDPARPAIPQYTQRSEGMKDRPKVIHMPAHVVSGGISTHGIWPVPGYKRSHLTESQAVLKHYRPCRTQYVAQDWCSDLTRHTDNSTARIFNQIEENIADAKRQIGIT